jgi:hypothetical protein
MFEEARERRRLRRNLAEARRLEVPHLSWGEPDFDARSEEFLKARVKVRMAEHAIDLFETDVLLERARKYGVDEPTDPSCWADDSEAVSSPEEVTFWLTRKGQGKLLAGIREQRRRDWQFWIYLITALTGLGGTIIGIISALKR